MSKEQIHQLTLQFSSHLRLLPLGNREAISRALCKLTKELEADSQLAFNLRPKSACSNEQLKAFDPYIKKLMRIMVFHYWSSDVCMDEADLFQEARILVWNAYREYDSSRGAKVETFVFLKLFTKFINYGEKFKGRNKVGTKNFSSIANKGNRAEEYSYEDAVNFTIGGTTNPEDAYIDAIDRKNAIEAMPRAKRSVYVGRFVKGMTMREIEDTRRSPSSARKVRALFTESAQAHTTVVLAEAV